MIGKMNRVTDAIELTFLNLAMRIMKSESKIVKKILEIVYCIKESVTKHSFLYEAVAVGFLGIAVGFTIGIIAG